MQIFRRVLLIIAILIVIAVITGGILIHRVAHRALPDYNENITIDGIEHEVEVYRDSLAIPHIYAQTEEDLYMAVGYLMAQDRLWQMDLLRRVTQGRLSEIFGKKMVDNDHLMRSLRISKKSKKVLEKSDEKLITALQSFSRGVNKYIEIHSDQLPPEFTILGYKPYKWQPFHTVNLIGYMAWDLSPAWESEVILHKISQKIAKEKYRLLIPKIEEQNTLVFPKYSSDFKDYDGLSRLMTLSRELENMGLKVFTGSNNWAVSSGKSKTGQPLLANDMHLGLSTPGIWYQMHQVVEGKMNVSGVALPGQPLINVGHNDTIAWGMTNVMLDDMDFYKETINPEDSSEYRFNGDWKKMEVVKEKIEIKGEKPVIKKIRYTHRGPIISGFKDVKEEAVSMKWMGNEYSNEFRSVYLLNHASNWSEFKNAARTFTSLSQNIAYADIKGNIGLYCCAGIPVREGTGIGIYPGETDKYDWKGLVPFDELPHSYNPKKGFVASANNNVVSKKYPFYISHWFHLSSRIDRINQMLRQEEKLSVSEFIKIQTDYKSLLVPRFKSKIIKYVKEMENQSPIETTSLGILKNWNNVYTKHSSGAAIFDQFYIKFVENLIRDELGEELYKEYISSLLLVRNMVKNIWNNPESSLCDDIHTENKKERLSDIVQRSFTESVEELSKQMGKSPERWEWGKLHQLSLNHPIGGEAPIIDLIFNMNRGPFEMGGSFHTVCQYSYPFTDVSNINLGPSQRHVYSTANWNSSRTILPTGISGIPASKHYCDQTHAYLNLKYKRELFSKKLVKQHAQYYMTIKGY